MRRVRCEIEVLACPTGGGRLRGLCTPCRTPRAVQADSRLLARSGAPRSAAAGPAPPAPAAPSAQPVPQFRSPDTAPDSRRRARLPKPFDPPPQHGGAGAARRSRCRDPHLSAPRSDRRTVTPPGPRGEPGSGRTPAAPARRWRRWSPHRRTPAEAACRPLVTRLRCVA